jgi:serine/threonine-protein kinase
MSPQARSDNSMIGRVVLGRYRILRHLADGGMGAIYLARSEGSSGFVRPVVVKCVLPRHIGDDKMVSLFAREARIMANLRHPGIVSVIDFAQDGDMHIMVMDYVHGFHLGRWQKFSMRTRGEFSAEIAIHIIISVLRALHYAHTLRGADGKPLNIVHRDVTPSNVLLDVEGHVKLADFGIAQMSTDRTEVGKRAIKGKFPYLAPEILENAEPSPTADVYSAGVTLHQLLVGRNEFAASGVPAIVSRVLKHIPTPVDQVRPDVAPELAAVVARSLEKKPPDRYPSAAAFAEALANVRSWSEDQAARQLAELAASDFRDPRMAEMLALPQLNELESDWTTPASSIHDLTDPDVGVAEKVELAEAPTAPGVDNDGEIDEDGYARCTPRRRTPIETLDKTIAESPAARVKKIGSTGEAPDKRSRAGLWLGLAGGVALLGVGGVAVLALLKSSGDGSRTDDEPAVVVVSDRTSAAAVVAPDAAADAAPAAVSPAPADAAPRPPAARRQPRTTAARLTTTFGKQKSKVAACFRKHTAGLEGSPQMSIRFSVDTDGNVTSAEVLPASVQSTALGSCLLDVARATQFGAQSKSVTFRVPIKARVK